MAQKHDLYLLKNKVQRQHKRIITSEIGVNKLYFLLFCQIM